VLESTTKHNQEMLKEWSVCVLICILVDDRYHCEVGVD
jgi:hypothetical protein